ncbi:MAG TPA: CHAP domain-containing protein [Flavobacteriaceae bacterium]|nr:CHAP domain-containing protein [Flavobacteriaceae bacterium]
MAWQALLYKRVLLSTFWLFILPIALDVGPPVQPGARERLQAIYVAAVGVREATGNNDGLEVEVYLATTNLGPGYPWCAAFVSWVFEQEGYDQPRTPWTPALFPSKRIVWPGKGQTPELSDVFGIYISSKKRIGHAGFVEKWGEHFVIGIEGNTNPAGSHEGDGVYRRRRRTKTIHRVADWVENNDRNQSFKK